MNRVTLTLIAALGLIALVAIGGFIRSQQEEGPMIKSFQATVKGIIDGDTIKVHFDEDQEEIIHSIRLAGIDTPTTLEQNKNATCPLIAGQAQSEAAKLTPIGSPVSIALGRTGDAHIPYYTSFDRLLGFVRTLSDPEPIQRKLVKKGLARIDIRQGEFGPHKFSFATLFQEKIKDILDDQTDAAQLEETNEKSWWNECDPFRGAQLVITAINFWGEPQVVYMVNRGEQPINLTKFVLSDKGGNELRFGAVINSTSNQVSNEGMSNSNAACLEILGHGLLKIQVHTQEQKSNFAKCNSNDSIEWFIRPINGPQIWNQSAREDQREIACLILADKQDSGCNEDSIKKNPQSNGICYIYQYPPGDGTQTQSFEIDPRCH